MNFQFLNDLKVDKQTKKIKVRIAKLWKGINPAEPNKLLSLKFVVVDAQVNYN